MERAAAFLRSRIEQDKGERAGCFNYPELNGGEIRNAVCTGRLQQFGGGQSLETEGVVPSC
jgi:hypothetical protein